MKKIKSISKNKVVVYDMEVEKNHNFIYNGTILHNCSYCGDGDIWFFPAFATRDTAIKRGNRICQFRIVKKMTEVKIIEVDQLTDPNRGGHGSTGI